MYFQEGLLQHRPRLSFHLYFIPWCKESSDNCESHESLLNLSPRKGSLLRSYENAQFQDSILKVGFLSLFRFPQKQSPK